MRFLKVLAVLIQVRTRRTLLVTPPSDPLLFGECKGAGIPKVLQ